MKRDDSLNDRVSCRWKGENADGQNWSRSPDIDEGVTVNITPAGKLDH